MTEELKPGDVTLADLITMIDMVENHTDAINLADKVWPMMQAPAAAQQTPVAWQWLNDNGEWKQGFEAPDEQDLEFYGPERFRALYAAPLAQGGVTINLRTAMERLADSKPMASFWTLEVDVRIQFAKAALAASPAEGTPGSVILEHADKLHDLGFEGGWNAAVEECVAKVENYDSDRKWSDDEDMQNQAYYTSGEVQAEILDLIRPLAKTPRQSPAASDDEVSQLQGIITRSMDMLADVPGDTLEDRLTKYIGCYMELQLRSQPECSEIERLRAQVEKMTAALEPFAAIAKFAREDHRDNRPVIYGMDSVIAQRLTIGQLRRASAALSSTDSEASK